jgi:long-subunit fatty acid transport protein
VNPNNRDYISASNPQNNSLRHNFFVTESGANRKHSFTLSTQYTDNLYLGININNYSSEFKRADFLRENDYGVGSGFIETEFENELSTLADGFSIQLGAIYKASQNIRLGLSYQSPTWYSIQEELVQYLGTYRNSRSDQVDPQIINIYEYNIKTPSKLSTGLAYVFGSKGLISFEYNLVNFQNIEFDTQQGNDIYIDLNKDIKSTLKKATSYSVGGEYRIEELSLRGGYFSNQSLNKTASDLSNGYSLGIGYDLGGSNISVTLLKQKFEKTELIFQKGLDDPINLKNDQFQIAITYSLKL